MAEKTSLSLSMTAANGDKLSKAVTDVNPAADNAALKSFAQGLAALTTNTLNTVSKISKEDIDKNYTPLTFAVDTNIANSSLIPTKIDDTHYTIAHADLRDTSKGVYCYKEEGGEGGDIYWACTRLNITPLVKVNSYVTVEPKASNAYIWFATDVSYDASNWSYIELSVFSDANDQTSNFVGVEFNIIVPAGSTGSTNWDTYTINFKIV